MHNYIKVTLSEWQIMAQRAKNNSQSNSDTNNWQVKQWIDMSSNNKIVVKYSNNDRNTTVSNHISAQTFKVIYDL